MKTIFLSYCHKDFETADMLCSELSRYPEIKIVRDKIDLKHQDNLEKFMESIRDTDCSIIIISQSYLTSQNCMKELMHLMKERSFESKAIFLLTDHSIYNEENKDSLFTFWNNRIESLSDRIKEYENNGSDSPKHIIDSRAICRQIRLALDIIVEYISNHFLRTISELMDTNLEEIVRLLGYEVLLQNTPVENAIIKGFKSEVSIVKGVIKYDSSTIKREFMNKLNIPIIGGKITRNSDAQISAIVETLSPYDSIQELNEITGLSTIEVFNSEKGIVISEGQEYKFTGNSKAVIPANTPMLDMQNWQYVTFPFPITCVTLTELVGKLSGKALSGRFVGRMKFTALNMPIPEVVLGGSFEVELN